MTRNSQSKKLKEINSKIEDMSKYIEEQLKMAIGALKENDYELGKKAILFDDKVDNIQKEIEEYCIKLIATEQPLAVYLRRVFSASKIVTDLERIGDHSVDISKIAMNIENSKIINYIDVIFEIEEKLLKMLKLSIRAYIDGDFDSAYKISKLDDEIDKLYEIFFDKTLESIGNNIENKKEYTKMLFVAKYLERIGDHVTNICEWVIFVKKGQYVDLNE